MLLVKLQNAAIVILSVSNNPRLLNGDFLKRNAMVPDEWPVIDTLVTPPVAQVTFENGVHVLVEENRLNFAANRPDAVQWQDVLPRLAHGYMDTLPHVTYRGAGLNFVYTWETSQNEEGPQAMIRRLLHPGQWLDYGSGMSGAVVELQYRNDLPHMNVKIGTQEKTEADGAKRVSLVFNVNFHHDFQPEQKEERGTYIDSIRQRNMAFLEFLATLPFDGDLAR
jgi:hypothetical protein